MISNVGLNLSDSGLNFLYAFFIFWSLIIVVGVILQVYEMGFRPGNFKKRGRELFRKYVHQLERKHRPPKQHHVQ